jgi:hypothetical protein
MVEGHFRRDALLSVKFTFSFLVRIVGFSFIFACFSTLAI